MDQALKELEAFWARDPILDMSCYQKQLGQVILYCHPEAMINRPVVNDKRNGYYDFHNAHISCQGQARTVSLIKHELSHHIEWNCLKIEDRDHSYMRKLGDDF